MRENHSGSRGTDRLEISYTDKPVSGWGGLVLVMRFFDRLGLREMLKRALPDGRTSNNHIPAVDIVLSFFATVLTGGNRFAHAERIRADEVVRGILDVPRLSSAMTLTRYFGGFVRGQVEHMSAALSEFALERLAPKEPVTLDLDSTVFERYGKQEGSLKGHNPRKHGRPSHHPLLAMMSGVKLVLHAWLRSGNAGTSRGVTAFLAEALALLPERVKVYAVRADSGFFIKEFLDDLDGRGLAYAIVVRMTKPVQLAIAGIREWRAFGPGLEAAELMYQAHGWKKPRRLVVVREEIRERPEARGRKLFHDPGYTFHAIVTTLDDLVPEDAWRFYNGRADCENRLKELKDDFGASGFCLHSFDGTEAAFRLVCFLFNMVAEFKREVTRDDKPQLDTLRARLLVVGAILGAAGRNRVLRLGLKDELRADFEILLARIAVLSISTVAQSNFSDAHRDVTAPSPWRERRHRRRQSTDRR